MHNAKIMQKINNDLKLNKYQLVSLNSRFKNKGSFTMKSLKLWVKLYKKYEVFYTILLQKDRLCKLKRNKLDSLLTDKQLRKG